MTFRVAARSKYHAKKTTVDGIVFASKKEAARYQELRLLEKAGEISKLHLQPVFPLLVPTSPRGTAIVGKYIADFSYHDANDEEVVEDVKGIKTAVYRLKKRMVEAQYGIRISEV